MNATLKPAVSVFILCGAVSYLLLGWFGACDAVIDPIKFLPAIVIAAVVYGYVRVRQPDSATIIGVSALIGSLAGIGVGYAAPWICF